MMVSLITLLLQACADDPAVLVENEKVQFTFSQLSIAPDGGRLTSQLPAGASLRISITDPAGHAVVTNQTVNILRMGEAYITEPLELKPSNYIISDFLIVKDSEVLFATPKRGSPLATTVEHALPFTFKVSKNEIANIEMQVVDVKTKQPEDFGYVSFDIDVVSQFEVSVFIYQNGKVLLTEATAYILDDTTLVKTYSLQAKTNIISFTGDPEKLYTLEIQKSGYGNFIKEFTYTGIKDELADKPLKVILEPALELKMVYHFLNGDNDQVRLNIEGEGEITISGPGDNTGTFTLPVHIEDLFDGFYKGGPTLVNTTMTIEGDLDKITSFESFGYNGGIVKFSGLNYLTALQDFSPGIKYNDKADFSSNIKLQSLDLFWAGLPEWIVLPKEHYIKSLVIAPGTTITREQADGVIDNVYNNTTKRLIRNGYLFLQYSEDPSEDSKDKLRILQNDYAWEVHIEIQE
jgi:hypothetical protein